MLMRLYLQQFQNVVTKGICFPKSDRGCQIASKNVCSIASKLQQYLVLPISCRPDNSVFSQNGFFLQFAVWKINKCRTLSTAHQVCPMTKLCPRTQHLFSMHFSCQVRQWTRGLDTLLESSLYTPCSSIQGAFWPFLNVFWSNPPEDSVSC